MPHEIGDLDQTLDTKLCESRIEANPSGPVRAEE